MTFSANNLTSSLWDAALHSKIATIRKYYLSVRPEDIESAGQIVNKIMEGVKSD